MFALASQVITAFRYVAIALSAGLAAVVAVSPAFADSINLLRPAARGLSPSIMIDTIKRSSGDEASQSIDQDCIVIADRTRNSSASRNSARFNFGQLAWSWDQTDDASVIYILCVDPKEEPPAFGGIGGGGGMSGAWSWPGVPLINREGPGATAETLAINIERPILTAIPATSPATTNSDVAISNIATGSSDTAPMDWSPSPPFQPAGINLLDPDALNDFFASGSGFSSAIGDGGFGSGNEDLPIAPFDPPIALDPQEMAPVPEPGTWLLLGTGLAVAWRARRHK